MPAFVRAALFAIVSLGLLGLGAAHASAAGTLTNQTVGGAASPSAHDVSVRGPVELVLAFDSTYDGDPPLSPKMIKAFFDLDDDFLITQGSTPQCDPGQPNFNTSTTAEALGLCPGAQLGSGAFELKGPVAGVTGISTTFNATPNTSGVPRIVLHLRTTANTTTVMVGTLATSGVAGFGPAIDFAVPVLPLGFVFQHLDFRLGQPGTPSADTYVTARCADSDRVWNYTGSFTFDNATLRTDVDAQPCSVALPITATPLPITATPPKPKSKKKKKKKRKRRKKK